MYKFFKLFSYYILLFSGLIITSWIIWSRFIRERTIKNIPDALLTEYRFWILLYICLIYIWVIKNLIKPSKAIPGFKEIIDILYTPLTTLDHLIKYNKYIKEYYNKLMFKFIAFLHHNNINDRELEALLFFIQIFPRIILVTFLFLDTFYFHKLEIFYKIVLIGILPFILRYVKYSCKDIYEYWIQYLEQYYESVTIYEDDYRFDETRKGNTEAIYHYEKKTIREYIEIKFENMLNLWMDKVEYIYEATPHYTQEYLDRYMLKTYNGEKRKYRTVKDIEALRALYFKFMPEIIKMKVLLERVDAVSQDDLMRKAKIIIFSMYLICWSFILFISYLHFPVELFMGKILIINLMSYLIVEENPFNEEYWGSRNENLVTIENVKKIYSRLIEKILNKFRV